MKRILRGMAPSSPGCGFLVNRYPTARLLLYKVVAASQNGKQRDDGDGEAGRDIFGNVEPYPVKEWGRHITHPLVQVAESKAFEAINQIT